MKERRIFSGANPEFHVGFLVGYVIHRLNNNTAVHFRNARYRQLAESGTSNALDFQITDSRDHTYTG